MAACPKCNAGSFRLKEATPYGSPFILNYVECSSCGVVVGVLDYFNIGEVLKKQNEALRRIASAVGVSVDLGP